MEAEAIKWHCKWITRPLCFMWGFGYSGISPIGTYLEVTLHNVFFIRQIIPSVEFPNSYTLGKLIKLSLTLHWYFVYRSVYFILDTVFVCLCSLKLTFDLCYKRKKKKKWWIKILNSKKLGYLLTSLNLLHRTNTSMNIEIRFSQLTN